jgi:hypothetical protein
MAKQAKRERQRVNREARRQAELAAARRRKQWRTARTIAIFAVPLVIVLVVFQLRSSGGSEPTRKFSKPPAQTLKPDTQYTATMDTGGRPEGGRERRARVQDPGRDTPERLPGRVGRVGEGPAGAAGHGGLAVLRRVQSRAVTGTGP